ncbi:MAG: hypothetical protein AAF791_11385 [Bacteroidota bacterium]
MRPSLRAFLTDLIDYAGLFPPALLDLAPAIANHLRYRGGPDAWMLGRFIIPAARLDDLAPHVVDAPGSPVALSVLGLRDVTGGIGDVLSATREAALSFEAQNERAVCDAFELRASASDVDAGLAGPLTEAGLGERDLVAVEVPLVGDAYAADRIEHAAHSLAETNARLGRQAVGLKLRCGGVTPDLVPSVERVAHAIVACREAGAPFKATAGLHHPVANHDAAVGTQMMGFVGFFGGACLAHAHRLDADALAEVLDDAEASHFTFDDEFAWRSLRVAPETIARVRQTAALSFGSCSFDEPREDLRALGWMGAA